MFMVNKLNFDQATTLRFIWCMSGPNENGMSTHKGKNWWQEDALYAGKYSSAAQGAQTDAHTHTVEEDIKLLKYSRFSGTEIIG